MKNLRDYRDHVVMVLVSGAWAASTAYIFMHPSDINFATWATFAGTTTGAFHWLTVKDDKTPDCGGHDASPT